MACNLWFVNTALIDMTSTVNFFMLCGLAIPTGGRCNICSQWGCVIKCQKLAMRTVEAVLWQTGVDILIMKC